MNYEFTTSIPYQKQEEYSNLSNDRKQQILSDLKEEIERQKAKYLIKSKQNQSSEQPPPLIMDGNKNRQLEIDELETITKRTENIFSSPNDMKGKSQRNEKDKFEYDQDKAQQKINNLEMEDSMMEQKNEGHYDEEEDGVNEYVLSNDNNEKERRNPGNRYEIFDKAKENLMKIKSDIDELDKYEVRKPLKPNLEKLERERERDIDDYITNNIAEEQPKNLEHEISMSMRSVKNDNNNPNLSQSNIYNFYNPINYQASYKDYEHKKESNNFMPVQMPVNKANDFPCDGQNSKSPIQHPSLQNIKSEGRTRETRDKAMTNGPPDSSSMREKEMNPYFKKMVKQYNPKYKEAKSKDKFERIKKEMEEKFEREHTFKPNVNYNFAVKERYSESRDEIYRRLSKPKTIEVTNRIKQNEMNEQQKMIEMCTFQPQIQSDRFSEESPQHYTSGKAEKVATRLHKLAEQMKEKREKMKREYQENEIKDLSFAPAININSKQLMLKYEQKPIYRRYEELTKQKNQNLQQIRQEIEKDEKSFYKPEINSKSKEIMMRKSEKSFNMDVHEKLYREGLTAKNKPTDIKNQESEECTFAPQLCYSITQEGETGNIDDFLERQKIYDELKKERMEKQISKSQEKKAYSFHPQINLTSDILMKADHYRANEDLKDKVDRLYKKDFEKIKQRKEQLETFYYAQYDYKPKINELSKFIGKDHTCEELNMRNEFGKAKKIREEKNNEAVGECTFKPKINKEKYEHIQSNYKVDENILTRIKSEMKLKNEKIEDLKQLDILILLLNLIRVLDEKDRGRCKFQPDIKREVPNFEMKEPMMMKGMAKYLEQMEKARKAKRDKEEREKEVFITGENWSRDNIITIPKPFNLSYQKMNAKKDDISKKSKDDEMKECTFKPMTNESKNKEIIKQILKE